MKYIALVHEEFDTFHHILEAQDRAVAIEECRAILARGGCNSEIKKITLIYIPDEALIEELPVASWKSEMKANQELLLGM